MKKYIVIGLGICLVFTIGTMIVSSQEKKNAINQEKRAAAIENANSSSKHDNQPTYTELVSGLDLKDKVKVIHDYGSFIKLDSPQAVQELHELHGVAIAEYQNTIDSLKFAPIIPYEHRKFHELLVICLSEFVVTMEEMDGHLSELNDSQRLSYSIIHYQQTVDALSQLSKEKMYQSLID